MTRQIILHKGDREILIGGNAPITVQSMCNTKTSDISATIAQITALEECGCDIVRVSVPDIQSAKAIKDIVNRINLPLVADIHYDYRLAIAAADNGASKIRINPGNIGSNDKVKYLADYLKERNIPIRIGVNGGSLDNKYKHLVLAEAMKESALEHVALLEKCGFYDIVLSVKSSNVKTNIEAYELLSGACDYPLHVGVTEAGVYEIGIIKSAIGIGDLLLKGIGDTIRVSLTGNPELEVTAGHNILNALDMGREHVEVISCPTCARTEIDVEGLAKLVIDSTKHIRKNIKIAVMGCVVNGPGEAGHCDFGVAGGKGRSAIFSKGKVLKTVDNVDLKKEILEYISQL